MTYPMQSIHPGAFGAASTAAARRTIRTIDPARAQASGAWPSLPEGGSQLMACSRDTNGDGNCGRPACPECGAGRLAEKVASSYEIDGADYYNCSADSEELTHQRPDDAIRDLLDSLGRLDFEVPRTVWLFGFRRMKIDWRHEAEHLVEDLLDRLNEELGNPFGPSLGPTPGMLAAAKVFMVAFSAEYKPWACEPCGSVMVDVQAWIKENRPEWLVGGADAQ